MRAGTGAVEGAQWQQSQCHQHPGARALTWGLAQEVGRVQSPQTPQSGPPMFQIAALYDQSALTVFV